jgi:hypothetical protein
MQIEELSAIFCLTVLKIRERVLKSSSHLSGHSARGMGRHWTEEEDNLLRQFIVQYGKQWSVIATHIPNRSATQIAARWEKCINPKLTKGPFSPEEDQLIVDFVERNGTHAWPKIGAVLPHRTAKQCRERWFNNLDPVVTKGPWTPEEDRMIFEAYVQYGPKWSLIARVIPGRTDNSIKNRWNASISKRIKVGDNGEQELAPCKIRKYSKLNKARPPTLQTGATVRFQQVDSSDNNISEPGGDPPTELGYELAPLGFVTPSFVSDDMKACSPFCDFVMPVTPDDRQPFTPDFASPFSLYSPLTMSHDFL